MPQFNNYQDNGRTLMVKFTCRRCGREIVEELEAHADDLTESYGQLHVIKPPEGWQELPYGPLLCSECYEAFLKFMNNSQEA